MEKLHFDLLQKLKSNSLHSYSWFLIKYYGYTDLLTKPYQVYYTNYYVDEVAVNIWEKEPLIKIW